MADLAQLRISVDSRDVRSAANDLNSLGGAASSAEGSTARLGSLFTKTNIAAAALGTAFAQLINMARDFEKNMAEVSTLIDTTVVSMDELSAAAREQAKTFGGDVQTQAKALYQIISAGASTAAEANDILTASNKLAVGGITDVATAADGLTSVLNAYGDKVGSAADVSDAMFVAMRAGKTTIGELSASLGSVAPLAAQMGVSFDELTAATAALTKGGVSTSVAMTGLRAILAAVAKPSDEAAKLATKLGIEFNSAAIQSKGLAGFMEELRVKTGGSQDAMAKLFGGVEALVPALALTGTAGEDLNAILDQMGVKAGSTDDAVSKMSQTFDVQFNKAVANVNDLLLQLGIVLQRTLLPLLTLFNNNIGNITIVLGGLIAAMTTYAGIQILVATRTALLNSQFALQAAAAISSARAIGGLATAQMLLATTATGAAAAGRALIGVLIANPFTAAAVAVGVLASAFINLRNAQAEARAETNNLITSLQALAAARSAEYVARRDEQVIAMLQKQSELSKLEKKLAEQTGVGAGYAAEALGPKIRGLKEDIETLDKGIEQADAMYRAAAEAANAMAVPVSQASVALDENARSAKSATNELSEAEKEMKRLTEQADDFIQSLTRENEQIGKTAIEIKKLGIEAAIAAAPTEELKNRIREAGAAWESATRSQARKDFEDNILRPLRNELELVGLTGEARALRALELEKEAFVAKATADGIEDVNKAWQEYSDLQTQIIKKESALEKEREEAERLKQELAKVLDFLDMVHGGLGGGLEIIVRSFLKMSPELKDDFKKIFDEFKIVLDDVFTKLGADLGSLGAGAAVGEQVGGIMKALGIESSRTGAQIGGAIGGAFGGPLGSLAGSILGGLVGGMLKSTPRASATIETIAGEAVVAGVRGNKGQLKTMAEGLARSMINGLQAIADELGGTIASGIKISIGVRNDTFRVDPLGLGRTKGMPEFKTEEEAIAYAIKLALERGAIEGIRQSTQTLLRAGDDLQAALQDAVDFEGVFDRLLEKTDPLAFGLKELEKEFERLNKIFEKAGATTEEFAELQRLYDLERADILEEERQRQMDEANKINDLILRLYREQGKEAEELALVRRMESEAASEAERAILAQIYALEDFNKARLDEIATLEDTITTMSQLASSLREFRAGLFGADQGVTNYKQALVDLIRVGSLAATGDVEALGQLQGVSQSFLAASRSRAGSLLDYQRDMALVASYVDQGITAADEQVSAAEQQIDLLQRQLEELVNIGELLTQPTAPDVSLAPSWNANIAGGGGGNAVTLPVDSSDMQAMLRDALYAIAKNTGATAQLLDRWDGDGQPDIREYAGDYY